MSTIYVVWGPTAEWGDGSGPLAYFLAREDAEGYIADERRDAIDRAAEIPADYWRETPDENADDYDRACAILGWPLTVVDFGIEETNVDQVLSDAGFDGNPDDETEVLDYLNGA